MDGSSLFLNSSKYIMNKKVNNASRLKVRKSRNDFVDNDTSKKRTNEFDSAAMIPQVDLFLFVFWKKSKTPKKHFEINCFARWDSFFVSSIMNA